jgi:hypothetical protein
VVYLSVAQVIAETNGPSSCYDYLQVFDGASTSAQSLGVFCGSTGGFVIVSSGTTMTLSWYVCVCACELCVVIDVFCSFGLAGSRTRRSRFRDQGLLPPRLSSVSSEKL